MGGEGFGSDGRNDARLRASSLRYLNLLTVRLFSHNNFTSLTSFFVSTFIFLENELELSLSSLPYHFYSISLAPRLQGNKI